MPAGVLESTNVFLAAEAYTHSVRVIQHPSCVPMSACMVSGHISGQSYSSADFRISKH